MNSRSTNRSGWVKRLLIPVLAIAAGTFVGASASLRKYQEPHLILADHTTTAATSKDEPPPVLKYANSRAYAPETTYDFGVMARNEELSHSFKVQNIGNGPLELKVLDTTCKCTVGSLGNDKIPAGETADVRLTWTARTYTRDFRQSATIETNDQESREIVFSVVGQVIQLAAPDQPFWQISRLSRSEGKDLEIKVYGYRDEDFEIVAHRWVEKDIAEFFDAEIERLPQEEWADDAAKSGERVTVHIKPGLPVGSSQQTLELIPNRPDIPPIEISFSLTIVSDISVLGGGNFNTDTNTLRLGLVSKTAHTTAKLHVTVKGKHRDLVHFSVASIFPESALDVEIGEVRELNNGAVRMFPLTIRVKPDSPNVNCMGSKQGKEGMIVFNTQHPEIDQLTLRVVFAVQD